MYAPTILAVLLGEAALHVDGTPRVRHAVSPTAPAAACHTCWCHHVAIIFLCLLRAGCEAVLYCEEGVLVHRKPFPVKISEVVDLY